MTSEEFNELSNSTNIYHRVEQKMHDAGGGIITKDEIDAISSFDMFDKVFISGLRQETFEYFVKTQGYKFKAIMFWKNKLVEDWSLLSTLKDVQYIGYFHNQRITQLWDMSENFALEGLFISDFTRLHTLEGINKAPNLQRLRFSDALWNTSTLEDLKPLTNSMLKEFCFGAKSINEEDITIYTKMPMLERLDFRTNLYTTEQLAWLTAKLPNVTGFALKPYIELSRQDLNTDNIIICGKRKPFLNSVTDAAKIAKYVLKFNQLVEEYSKAD